MSKTSAPATCPACRTIDRADGVEDGRLYPVVAKRIRHEIAVVRKIRTEQTRLTDGITNFALPDLRAFAPKGLQYSICATVGIFPVRI